MKEKSAKRGSVPFKSSTLVSMPRLIESWRAPCASVHYNPDKHALILEQLVCDPFDRSDDDPLSVLNSQPGPICFYHVPEDRVLRFRGWTACADHRHADVLADLLIAHARAQLRSKVLLDMLAKQLARKR